MYSFEKTKKGKNAYERESKREKEMWEKTGLKTF